MNTVDTDSSKSTIFIIALSQPHLLLLYCSVSQKLFNSHISISPLVLILFVVFYKCLNRTNQKLPTIVRTLSFSLFLTILLEAFFRILYRANNCFPGENFYSSDSNAVFSNHICFNAKQSLNW